MEANVQPKAFTALAALRFSELALSAYLPTDQGAGHHYYRALLDDLARADRHKLDQAERTALERELPAAVGALGKHRFDCPAVGLFTCQPQHFLRLWRLVDPVPGRIAVADVLDLAPVRLQLFEHPPALAALIDRQQARLYGLVLGELTEVGHLEGLPIRRHRQGGWSATALQRRQDEHIRSNLAEVADAVRALLERGSYRRLIVAGPTEARAELKSLLPPPALGLLVAEGPVPMYANGNELAERLRGLDRQPAHP